LQEITRLRHEIDRIDEELVWLLKTRYELAKQIGWVKKAQGLRIRDSQRELAILRRVEKIASTNSLPSDLIHRLFLGIFDLAVEAQSDRTVWHDLEGVQVLVVGGTGGMGRLFARMFVNHGASVKIFGRTGPGTRKVAREIGVLPGNYSDAGRADIVIVSVPMQTTLSLSLKLGSIIKPDSLLADLSSIKTGIADQIAERTRGFEYVSLHPLFGPELAHIGRQRIAAIPYRAGPLWQKLQLVFNEEGARLLRTTPHEHDKMTAQVQALHHFALITLGMTARITPDAFATRSYRATEDQIQRMASNWDTIIGIQMLNPFAAYERENFAAMAKRISAMTPADSKEALQILRRHVQMWSRKQ
jgi:chorismate mutase / prephenate dehydrogenase